METSSEGLDVCDPKCSSTLHSLGAFWEVGTNTTHVRLKYKTERRFGYVRMQKAFQNSSFSKLSLSHYKGAEEISLPRKEPMKRGKQDIVAANSQPQDQTSQAGKGKMHIQPGPGNSLQLRAGLITGLICSETSRLCTQTVTEE